MSAKLTWLSGHTLWEMSSKTNAPHSITNAATMKATPRTQETPERFGTWRHEALPRTDAKSRSVTLCHAVFRAVSNTCLGSGGPEPRREQVTAEQVYLRLQGDRHHAYNPDEYFVGRRAALHQLARREARVIFALPIHPRLSGKNSGGPARI